MSDEELAVISPSVARRVMAVGMLVSLGVVLIYLGFLGEGTGFGLRITFLALGVGALLLAERVWRATGVRLILTEAGLFDSNGVVLCRTEDIGDIERSAFAFKPSNGFAIRLKKPLGRAWVPGLWWRYGRRLGVGGVVAKQEAKMVADTVALRLRMAAMEAEQTD